jgi:hypothetical protein
MFRRRSTVAALVLLPIVAGAFLVQDRGQTDGARLLDQVFTLVSSIPSARPRSTKRPPAAS